MVFFPLPALPNGPRGGPSLGLRVARADEPAPGPRRTPGLRERALELEPEYGVAHTNLGAVYFKQQKLDQAAYHSGRALELEPDYPAAHANRGAVSR